MKLILQIVILLILGTNPLKGQKMDSILQKLLLTELINQKQVNEYQELIGDQEEYSNAIFLNALNELELRKLAGTSKRHSVRVSFISFRDFKPNLAEQQNINFELNAYLEKLKFVTLINEKQYIKSKSKIDNSEYVHLIQLLFDVIAQVKHDEYMNPDDLKAFANKLKSHEIVTTQFDKLVNFVENGEMDNTIEFLRYCDKALTINKNDYGDKPEDYLELIHKKTAEILPELTFTNFAFQVVLDSSNSYDGSEHYEFVVSIVSNGKKYQHKSYYRLYSPSKKEYYGNKVSQQEYYKIFNKVLADIQSPYRLHEVKSFIGNAYNRELFGIIALTKEQATELHGGGVYFSPSYETFKNTLTSQKIQEAIEEYQKIGILSHLTSEQIEIAKDKIAVSENHSLNDVLFHFPNTVLTFDTELSNIDDPYAELVKKYGLISHNDFMPTDISDNFGIEKKKVKLKFKFNNKIYEKTLEINQDWIDGNFLAFMEHIATENELKGQFYQLYEGGQGARIIYLTLEQYKFLRSNKLAIFADEWVSQMED